MKEKGQYFTISTSLQQFIFDHVQHKSSCLLEPSFGAGHLLQPFKAYNVNYPMVCYEVDSHIRPNIQNHHWESTFCQTKNRKPIPQIHRIVLSLLGTGRRTSFHCSF